MISLINSVKKDTKERYMWNKYSNGSMILADSYYDNVKDAIKWKQLEVERYKESLEKSTK